MTDTFKCKTCGQTIFATADTLPPECDYCQQATTWQELGGKSEAPPGAWREKKRIRGHLYWYWRWRDGDGVKRSQYIGKA